MDSYMHALKLEFNEEIRHKTGNEIDGIEFNN